MIAFIQALKEYAAKSNNTYFSFCFYNLWQICDELTKEKENFKDNARKEIQQDIELLRKERDAEIQQIHKRVQHAIGKKDNSVEALQKENTTLRDRCLKLETIIRQQRKDYCTKWIDVQRRNWNSTIKYA